MKKLWILFFMVIGVIANVSAQSIDILDSRFNVVGRLNGNEIQDSRFNVIGRIRGDEIQDSRFNVIGRIRGNEIQDSRFNVIGRVNGTPTQVKMAALLSFFFFYLTP